MMTACCKSSIDWFVTHTEYWKFNLFKSGLETAKMHLIFAALLLLARKELRQKRHSFTRFWNKLNMLIIICHVLSYADHDKSFEEFLTKLFKGDNPELPSSASEQCFSGCFFFLHIFFLDIILMSLLIT